MRLEEGGIMRHTIRHIGISALLLAASVTVFADGPSVEIDKRTAAPGEVIVVRGAGISENGEIKLTLSGIQDYDLGTAQGGEHGRFEKQITLPGDTHLGNYILIAEGQTRASAKLQIVAASGMGAHQTVLPPASQDERMHGMEQGARAGPMEVQRPSGVAEKGMRWAVVLVSLILGLSLHRGRGRKNAADKIRNDHND